MTNPVHLLSVASLLLVAFLVGAVIGSLLRLLALRLRQKPAASVAAAEAPPASPPLVAAPVIAPLPAAPTPVAPPQADVPVPDFATTLIALAAESPPSFMEQVAPAADPATEMRPARVAGETTSGRLVPAPRHQPPPEPAATPRAAAEHEGANVIPFRSAIPDPAPEAAPTPVVADEPAAPAEAEAAPIAPPGEEPVVADASAEPASEAEPVAERPEPAAAPTMATPTEVAPPTERPASAEPAPEPIVGAAAAAVDEDAAMRAIEGNWTPRRPPRRRAGPPAPPPEGVSQAVAASARAVAAARRTAEAVVAEAAGQAGRPAGLDAPRDGLKDDLTHIIGVLPVIETALNQLGIYHFDQVGALTAENVAWIEGHLGLPGRIGREFWREQARELSAALKPRRAAEH
jgi:predicted flap endonuclease-1-like 5' DNA nuclease